MADKVVPYGYEVAIDLQGCDVSKFTRTSIEAYLGQLCRKIDMKREDLHFWDDVGVPKEEQQTSPQTKGTSAVQFILTSTVVIHALDLKAEVYVNIFSCKSFDRTLAANFTATWFSARQRKVHYLTRGAFDAD